VFGERCEITVLRRSWLRTAAPLTSLIVAATLAGTANPAQANASGPDRAASTDAAPPAARFIPVTVRSATTEQIREMAAQGNGQMITDGGQAAEEQYARDGAVLSQMVLCYLSVGFPYGGGSYNRPVYVTATVYCDDFVQLAVLTVNLIRGDDLVGTNYAAYYDIDRATVTAASAGCQSGIHYGVASGTIYFYSGTPPTDSTVAFGPPLNMGCAPAPPTPAFAVTNPGNQASLEFSGDTLQMTATGGTTPYTWSAVGLPTGLSINASTGLISGPTYGRATYTVTVTAVDAAGRTASTQFTWLIHREVCPTC
jgi:hypothetical protein